MNATATTQRPLSIIPLLFFFAFLPTHATAHPVPNENHDRTILIRLTPTAVVVQYRLEVDEARAARDMPAKELTGIGSVREFHAAFSRFFADVLADNLVATLDGQELTFRPVHRDFLLTDHLRCDYRFEAAWNPVSGKNHVFKFREGNYDGDSVSRLHVTLIAADGIGLNAVTAPNDDLLNRPAAERGPGDDEKLRTASAQFEVTNETPRGSYKPALAPDPSPDRKPPATASTTMRAAPRDPVAFAKPFAEPEPPTEEKNLLHLLLDSKQGFFVLLMLAAGFGAVHALTPGHGKTLVAAYLVGERGTVWHALVLGLVTTLTHTGAVLLIAAVLPLFFPDAAPATLQTIFGLVGGLLVTGLGCWLLMVRLTGRADHVHLGGGHHHGHSHGNSVSTAPTRWWSIVLMGISGGIVPCADAIGMLCFAIASQRLWLALPLLLAFSAGLAGVLIAIGIGVVYARNFAGNKMDRWRPFFKVLPIVSAAVVTVLGLWLCYDSVHPTGR